MNEKLVAARKNKNWKQARASEEIRVELRTYQRWERGTHTPQPYYRDRLCGVFGMSLKELGYDFLAAVTTEPIAQLHGNGLEISHLNSIEEQSDWASWFGLKLAQILGLLRMIPLWSSDFSEEIQTLVDQEIKMIDETLAQHQAAEQQAIPRRQALVSIAALPLALLGLRSGPTADAVTQEFLSQCAASVTSCWHLMRGKWPIAVSEILPQYVPLLATAALRPSNYQQAAARLTTQTSIIQAILAMHRLNFTAREAHCHDAIRYARISQDNKLQAASLMYLGYTYSHCYYPRQPQKAIPIFHQALHVLGNEESLLRSDILMGLSEAYAQCKEEQEALHFMDQAQKHFPAYPEHDVSFIYADCGFNTLYQWQGKMYLQLVEHFPDAGYQQKAATSLLQSIGVDSISVRSASETMIYQADAARALGELKIYAETLRQATQKAREIRSQRRYHDALLVYQRTPEKWVNERSIQALAKDLFNQLPTRKDIN